MWQSTADMDYPIDENFKFWAIIYAPLGNSESGFEIIEGGSLVEDSWNYLSRGANVVVKYGCLTIDARIVGISDKPEELRDEFSFLVTRFQEDYLEYHQNEGNERDTNQSRNLLNSGPSSTFDDVLNSMMTELKKKYPSEDQLFEANFSTLKKMGKSILSRTPSVTLRKSSQRPNITSRYDSSSSGCSSDESSPYTPRIHKPQRQILYKIKVGGNLVISNGMVTIGTNGSKIPENLYNNLTTWKNHTRATRKLMYSLFTRETLGTHSLTGNPSPAFRDVDKGAKPKLNPDVVEDVISIVCLKTNVTPTLVRRAITSICGDNSKQSTKCSQKKKIIKPSKNMKS